VNRARSSIIVIVTSNAKSGRSDSPFRRETWLRHSVRSRCGARHRRAPRCEHIQLQRVSSRRRRLAPHGEVRHPIKCERCFRHAVKKRRCWHRCCLMNMHYAQQRPMRFTMNRRRWDTNSTVAMPNKTRRLYCVEWTQYSIRPKRSAICNRSFPGPTRVLNANGISIASEFSAGLTR